MMDSTIQADVKQQVREFYDQVGWQEVGEGLYQNARYEDLRPVSHQYIHSCHLRVARHLKPNGEYFLDAGSGPIQYPEYLEYSWEYHARVCLDISGVALKEARQRIGDRQSGGHGLFVVGDVANLPFKPAAFDGVVSLHTIHHLPGGEQRQAYLELYRVLAPGSAAVVVNGWDNPPLTRLFAAPIRWANQLRAAVRKLLGKSQAHKKQTRRQKGQAMVGGQGTHVSKKDAAWLKQEVGSFIPLEILVWRSVSVKFLRAFIQPRLGGRWFLCFLFWLEEHLPHFFGEYGQYPLIMMRKT